MTHLPCRAVVLDRSIQTRAPSGRSWPPSKLQIIGGQRDLPGPRRRWTLSEFVSGSDGVLHCTPWFRVAGCEDSVETCLPRYQHLPVMSSKSIESNFAKTSISVPTRLATESNVAVVLWHFERIKIIRATTPHSLFAQMLSARPVRASKGVRALSTLDNFDLGLCVGACFKSLWSFPPV